MGTLKFLSCVYSEIFLHTHIRISIFSVVELVVCAFGTIWAFMVSVTITAGLSKTCSSFGKATNSGNIP